MKYVFRLGFVFIPFLFLVGQNASGDSNRAKDFALISRGPATLPLLPVKKPLKLADTSAIDNPGKSPMLSSMEAVTPHEGSGMGVRAPVIRW